MKPAIVLVHGAFAGPASWNSVIDSLAGSGHPVIHLNHDRSRSSREEK